MLREAHEVEVIHLSADAVAPRVAFPVQTVRMVPSDPRSIAHAAGVIRERAAQAELVHSMAASALLPFRAFRPDCPWIHTEHWSALLAPSTAPVLARLALPLTRRLLARPDVVVAVGHRLASAIASHRSSPTVVIPNEVDAPEVRPRPSGPSVLVGVGGLIPRKGPDVAIRTIAQLRSEGMDARLIWAGEGPMRAELEKLAGSLGVADRVDLRGAVPAERVADVIAEGQVFLLPTQMETFGVAIAEALVAGRPVVVGAEGEQTSFVEEPDGVVVEERTAHAYAAAIRRVIDLNQGRSAEEIAERARGLFDPSRRRSSYADAYALAGKEHRSEVADVDVVIAVHDSGRRIDRAIESALSSTAVARVIVVCHNVEPQRIAAAAGRAGRDGRIEFASFVDDVRSPAGPFNEGLGMADGRYVSVLGSDDELTAGAIDLWRRTARRERADVVIAPLRHAGGARVPTPPTLRRRGLRGARDRLAYRTAPLGLIDRGRFGGLRFTDGVATGEDLGFTARMWFSDARLVRHRGSGEYLIHDGEGRVTFTPRSVADELRAVELLIADAHTRSLSDRERTALAVKLWRVSIFGAVHYRSGRWQEDDRAFLAELTTHLRRFAPRAPALLSRADADLMDALADAAVPDTAIDEFSRRRRRFLSPAALLPARVSRVLARDAPLRFAAATWWAARGW